MLISLIWGIKKAANKALTRIRSYNLFLVSFVLLFLSRFNHPFLPFVLARFNHPFGPLFLVLFFNFFFVMHNQYPSFIELVAAHGGSDS